MRMLFCKILILITALSVYAGAKAQHITLNVKNEKLETVMAFIKKQSGYEFSYEKAVLRSANLVTLNLKNAPLADALKACFTAQPITYDVIATSIVLKVKKPAQTIADPPKDKVIRGRVTDGKGKPIPGATIKIKDFPIGTITDADGRFKIEAPDGVTTLLISSVGYLTIQKPVKDEVFIDIALIESTAQLKEVTVLPINTGYEAIKPERFVGSATVIDSAILSRTVSRNLLSRLDGTTNGLIFIKSGTGLPKMNLRGIATLGGSAGDLNGQPMTNPLIILDDFPYSGDLNSINPNDIESITVLKDAASASVWGAKAGNGVIVITSKKGKYNSGFNVNISSSLQVEEKPDLSYFPWMNSGDFIDVEQFLFDKGFQDIYLQRPNILLVSPAVEIMDKKKRGIITDAEATRQLNVLRGYDVRNDYDKYVFRNSANIQNYLSISGGSSNINYNIAVGTDHNKTSIKGPGHNNRYNITSNLSLRPVKFLEIQSGLAYTNENISYDGLFPSVVTPINRRSKLYPYARLADDAGNHLPIPYKYTMSFIDAQANQNLLDWHYRPLDEKDFVDNTQKASTLRLNLGITVNILSWLKADVKYQYSDRNAKASNLYDQRTYIARDLINSYTTRGSFERVVPLGGILDQGYSDLKSQSLRGQFTVNKNWNDDHSFNAIVAAEINESDLSNNTNRVFGYDKDNLTYSTTMDYSTFFPLYFGGASQIPGKLEISNRTDKLVSLLANSSYTYKNRYTLYGSARRDGSNLFGVKTNNKWKPLWSVGAKYTISNEEFFKVPSINNLAVRASYGYTGNVNNTVPAFAILAFSSSLNTDQQQFAVISSPPNPDLRWESVRTTNVGIDFGLLKNRISGTIDVFDKKSNDVISSVPSDPTLGVGGGVVLKNVANLKSRGIDVGVTTRNLTGKLNWTTSFNYSHVKTTVAKFFQNFVVTPRGSGMREGDLFGAIYAYKWAGLDPENGDPRGYLGKTMSKDYNKIFLDSVSNQVYVGSPLPLHFGNIMNTVSYQNFELSFNISFRASYYFRKPALSYSSLYTGWDGHNDYTNRWRTPGDEKKTNVPSQPYPVSANRDEFYAFSEVNYEKGDHIRFQDLRIAYNFSNNVIKKLPVKSISLYMVAGNLNWMIWKASKSNFDPDFPTSELPPRRTLSLGARISL